MKHQMVKYLKSSCVSKLYQQDVAGSPRPWSKVNFLAVCSDFHHIEEFITPYDLLLLEVYVYSVVGREGALPFSKQGLNCFDSRQSSPSLNQLTRSLEICQLYQHLQPRFRMMVLLSYRYYDSG